MTIHPLINHEPEAMSRRAQTYIMAGGWRHFLLGASMVAFPWLYSAAAFIPIFNLFGGSSVQVWAWIMVAVGLVCLIGSSARNANLARAGMVGSAVVTLVLGAGLALGVVNVWIAFVHTIGWPEVLRLVVDRPTAFPTDLLRRTLAPPSPFLPLLLLSLTVKDFTMCAQPLRVPLEDRQARAVLG